jgi:uncharacterized protein (DUF58 family)
LDLKRWLPLFVVVIILGVILRVPFLVTFILMLLMVLSLATWWQKRLQDGMIYQRRTFYRRAFPGIRVALKIEIKNR